MRFRLHFLNETDEVQQVGLTPTFPAKIVPMNLAKSPGFETKGNISGIILINLTIDKRYRLLDGQFLLL